MNRHDIKPAFVQQWADRLQPIKRLLGCVCLWLVCNGPASAADNPEFSEYEVKAGYLFNLPQFTDWPASVFASAEAPIVIGILGDDPFGKTLDELVKGDIVRGHPLVIKRLKPGDDLQSCQVLFISGSEKKRTSSLLKQLKGSPVLTVGDDTDFADQGGMVNFVLVQEKKVVDGKTIIHDKVRLEINPVAAEQAGLQISAKLLKLARIVNPN